MTSFFKTIILFRGWLVVGNLDTPESLQEGRTSATALPEGGILECGGSKRL